MGQFVAQLNPRAQGPICNEAALLDIGVLRTSSGDQAQPAGDGMAPAQIDDVDINLAAGTLGKLKILKSVDNTDLIMTRKQMAVAGLNRDLVAVDESFRGVVEVSVAESTRHSNRGYRTESLNHIEHRRVREPGNVANRTELAAAELVAAGQATTRPSSAHAAGGKIQARVAAKADLEGTVGQIIEGIP